MDGISAFCRVLACLLLARVEFLVGGDTAADVKLEVLAAVSQVSTSTAPVSYEDATFDIIDGDLSFKVDRVQQTVTQAAVPGIIKAALAQSFGIPVGMVDIIRFTPSRDAVQLARGQPGHVDVSYRVMDPGDSVNPKAVVDNTPLLKADLRINLLKLNITVSETTVTARKVPLKNSSRALPSTGLHSYVTQPLMIYGNGSNAMTLSVNDVDSFVQSFAAVQAIRSGLAHAYVVKHDRVMVDDVKANPTVTGNVVVSYHVTSYRQSVNVCQGQRDAEEIVERINDAMVYYGKKGRATAAVLPCGQTRFLPEVYEIRPPLDPIANATTANSRFVSGDMRFDVTSYNNFFTWGAPMEFLRKALSVAYHVNKTDVLILYVRASETGGVNRGPVVARYRVYGDSHICAGNRTVLNAIARGATAGVATDRFLYMKYPRDMYSISEIRIPCGKSTMDLGWTPSSQSLLQKLFADLVWTTSCKNHQRSCLRMGGLPLLVVIGAAFTMVSILLFLAQRVSWIPYYMKRLAETCSVDEQSYDNEDVIDHVSLTLEDGPYEAPETKQALLSTIAEI